jgi:hypothetical protein
VIENPITAGFFNRKITNRAIAQFISLLYAAYACDNGHRTS